MENIKHILITLISLGAATWVVVAISYFTWDYNVQKKTHEFESQKAYAEAMAERERTRQEWIKAITVWDGKVLVIPERLIVEEESSPYDPLQSYIPAEKGVQ